MRAGDALGLLAGLGALSALSGGRNGTGKRFTGLMDMLDGGGAGASGDRFEGGGLLSALGNLFAKPLEAQDRVERIAADTAATNAVTKTLQDMAKGGALTSRLDGKDGLLSPAQKEQIVMDQVVNPDVYRIGEGGEFAGAMSTPDMYNIGSAGEFGGLMSPENMPRPSATTAALSPAGNTASGFAPVPPMSEQLSPIAPATPTTPYPSAMSPAAPSMPQGIMSFRDFVDAERAAMSGSDLQLDPANYRRGYARYLRSMGLDPAAMGM